MELQVELPWTFLDLLMANNGSGKLFDVLEQSLPRDKYFPWGQNRALWINTVFFMAAVDILPESCHGLLDARMGK
jgi:hypothetical protein